MAKQRRLNPSRCISFSRPHNEYIDAKTDEFGISASSVVRKAIEFFIEYAEKPAIMARLVAEVEREKAEAEAASRRVVKRIGTKKVAA